MDSKVVLIAAIALFAVAAAVVLLLPGTQDGPVVEMESVAPELARESATAVAPAEPGVTVGTAVTPLEEAPQTASAVAAAEDRRVVATYFHNTTRCYTCRTIEERALETIETVFAAELASGRLVWRVLNMELRENEHYAYEYDLTSPSLVLAEMDGDREVRFKVLDAVWRLVHAKVQFASYIETEVRAYLEGI